jgi:hypothetical protein
MNQKELFLISVTIFTTVLVWIMADLVHIAHTEKLPTHDPRLSRPVKVEINADVITRLEMKK